MNQRERQVATLVAAGFTTAETASQLGISTSTVDRARALPDVAALIEKNEAVGLDPRAVLNALLYSKDQNIRMRAAVELAKLPDTEPLPPVRLAEGVKRVTIEDHLGTSTTRVYPCPPWEEPERITVPGCVWAESPGHGSPDNCGCLACRALRA